MPEDPTVIPAIEAHDIVVVLMWANLDIAQFDAGEWVRVCNLVSP
jgi:hypothetical protein